MKMFRKIVVSLLTAAILLMAVFLAGRYGWKALGFRACQGAGIESVSVSDHAVEIKGFYPGSLQKRWRQASGQRKTALSQRIRSTACTPG